MRPLVYLFVLFQYSMTVALIMRVNNYPWLLQVCLWIPLGYIGGKGLGKISRYFDERAKISR